MPPKLDRCVRAVTPKRGVRAAYAICTASLQRAGELPQKSMKTMSTAASRSAAARKGARTRKRNAAKKHRNPASACLPSRPASGKSRGFNVHEGDVFTYRGDRLKVVGCGIGSVSHKTVGAQTEGTYACLNEKTGKVRYLAKRTVRDAMYHHGILGRPAPRGPRTAAKRKRARAAGR